MSMDKNLEKGIYFFLFEEMLYNDLGSRMGLSSSKWLKAITLIQFKVPEFEQLFALRKQWGVR